MYILCKKLIAMGKTEGLEKKINTFYAVGELTEEQYLELTALLNGTEE